jgi:hypothetical protein
MKRRPLKTPPREFAFAADHFNLILDSTTDGERIAREREQAERDREEAARNQSHLFTINPK